MTTVSVYPLRTEGPPSEYVTTGPDRALWYTLGSDNIGRYSPTTGVVTQYPIPSINANPGPIIDGSDGQLWFIETGLNQFGVLNPLTDSITEVPVLPDGASQIQDLVAGPDGNIWFTEYQANKIGEINPTTHAIEEFSVPTANSKPYGITLGPDGNLWFTESGTNKVGMINPTTHTIVDFTAYTSGNAQAEGIATGSDGNLWFVDAAANAIGRINPYSDAVTTYTTGLSASAGLDQITPGPDGRLWFTETSGARIGAINPNSGLITEYTNLGGSNPIGIVNGLDGNVYFAGTGINSSGLARITSNGVSTTISTPGTSSGQPTSIVAGANGNLWFLDTSNQIGQVDTVAHDSLEYPAPLYYYTPEKLALDPADGSLWFTEQGLNASAISKINETTGVATKVANVPSAGAQAFGITYDNSDGNFWFTEPGDNSIAEINPTNGALSDEILTTLPSGAAPHSITTDSTGRLWFTESGTSQLAVYDPVALTVTQFSLPSQSYPIGITLGPDNKIWFVETGNNAAVCDIDPTTDVIQSYPISSAYGQIAAGPDGAIWFTEANAIGRIDTMTKAITTVAVTSTQPAGLAAGADGNLWFTAGTGNQPGALGTVNIASNSIATKLAITTQPPSSVTAGKGFGLIVTVENASGTVDTNYNGTVSVALGTNLGGSTLGGTLTDTAVNGVVFIPGLTLNNAGSGYTLVATASGLTSATSVPFNVTLGATHLVVIGQPPASVPATSPFSITVAAEDNSGNIDTSYNNTLDVALGNNSSSNILSGMTALGANNGVITFSGLSINNPGTDYTLSITEALNTGVTSGATAGFNVTPQPATQLVVTTQPPVGVVAGAGFGLTISAENSLGQVDTGDNASVSLSLTGGGNGSVLSGPYVVNLVAGVAVFSGLSINLVGASYAIQATSSSLTGSLTPATTNLISVVSASATTFTIAPVTPGNQILGVPFPVKVTAIDPFGNIATSYIGTVHLSSTTDLNFQGPADYMFGAVDNGFHVFQVTMGTLGNQNLTVADDSNSTITANTTIPVIAATPTTTTLAVTPTTSSVYRQSITLKATVARNNGTGTVTFLDGTTVIGTATLTSTGATLVYNPKTPLATGNHSFVAQYGGSTDKTLAPSQSSPLSYKVSPDTTSALASATTGSALLGQSVLLTATIATVSPGSGIATGTVKFLDGTVVLGTVNLDGSGHATLNVANLALGTHTISVSYSGDVNDGASASFPIKVYVSDNSKDDFDGDGKSDIAVYGKDPITGKYDFRILTSSSGFKTTVTFDNFGYGFGNAQSIPVPGNYFGDGRDAYALWTPNSLGGMTFTAIDPVTYKSITVNFGGTNQIPVVADLDGDGKDDFGVYGYLPGYGYSFDFLLSSYSFNVQAQSLFNNYGYGYGNAQSIPVVGDFDGNGHADLGLFNPSPSGSNFTYIDTVTKVGLVPKVVGTANDIPMVVDDDGDGKSDLALYGPDSSKGGNYRYLVLTAASGFNPTQAVTFNNFGYGYGNQSSIPIMADYEGDGKDDFGVYGPDGRGGMQFVYQTSQTGAGVTLDFATTTDLPLTAPLFLLAKKVRG